MRVPPALPLLLLALAPVAPTASAGPCPSPLSPLDGLANPEACLATLLPDACTPDVSQWRACLDWPCLILDGPMLHAEPCISRA